MQSTDLGMTWDNLSLGQLPLVQIYSIAEAGTTLTIATHGRGVWQLPLKMKAGAPSRSCVVR